MSPTLSKCIRPCLVLGVLALLSASLLVVGRPSPASASPAAQFTPFPTPTPGSDGRIIYVAQENDSLWRIAAIFNIDLNKLRSLNKWSGDVVVIHPGDEILLGFAGPAEPTPVSGPTLPPKYVTPTPTLSPGWGDLCVILYNDLNGDSQRQEEEPSIPGGAISVADRLGSVSKTEDTPGGLDYTCFKDLPEGQYNITVALPGGYNATTGTNETLPLKAGDTLYVKFGAQINTQKQSAAPPPQGNGRSPLLGIVGILVLLAGAALGLYAGLLSRFSRHLPKKSSPP